MRLKWTIIAALALSAAACMMNYDLKSDLDQTLDIPPAGENKNSVPAANGSYSPQEVAEHASGKDCWVGLHGRVYNVTGFIPFHPGGSAILEGCGKDATALFETRPMGSAAPHSSFARETAAQYYIGDIK